MKAALVVLLCMSFWLHAAQAETVPAEALDKDFTACMGGEDPQKDPERGEYCNCIRNSMKDWSLETYGQIAMEGSKAHDAAQEPPKLQEIAKACISKVLGPTP